MLKGRVAYCLLGGREEGESLSPHLNCLSLLLLIFVSTLPASGWVVELLVTDPRKLSLGTSLGILLSGRHQQR